jgi:hypothetical protein
MSVVYATQSVFQAKQLLLSPSTTLRIWKRYCFADSCRDLLISPLLLRIGGHDFAHGIACAGANSRRRVDSLK